MRHAPSAVDPRPVLAADGALVGSRCGACGTASAPAVPRCPACGRATEATTFPARGRVWSSTVVRAATGPDEVVPYVVSYVDVEDGPRVLTRMEGDEALPLDAGVVLRSTPAGDLAADLARVTA